MAETPMRDFSDDMDIAMSEVRHTVSRWLPKGDWRTYLVVRQEGKPNSFLVMAEPNEKSGFDKKLIELHKAEAEGGE